MAAWLAAGPGRAVVSHESALDLLDLADVIPNAIRLTVPRSRRGLIAPPGVLLHTTTRPPRRDETTEREGIRLTGPLRTILDAAERGTAPEQIVLAVGQALARGWLTADELGRGATERPHRAHRTSQLEERLAAGPGWKDHGLMFPSTVGTAIEPRNLTRHFKEVLKRADLPDIRFHDLRHTAATLLVAQGVHPRVVMEILGHSQISLTMNTYAHVLSETQREAAAWMDTLFPSIVHVGS